MRHIAVICGDFDIASFAATLDGEPSPGHSAVDCPMARASQTPTESVGGSSDCVPESPEIGIRRSPRRPP